MNSALVKLEDRLSDLNKRITNLCNFIEAKDSTYKKLGWRKRRALVSKLKAMNRYSEDLDYRICAYYLSNNIT